MCGILCHPTFLVEGGQAHSRERTLCTLLDLTCLSSSTSWLSRIDLARIECSRKRVGVVTGVRHGSSSPPDVRMISWISFGRSPSLRTRSSLSTLRCRLCISAQKMQSTMYRQATGMGEENPERMLSNTSNKVSASSSGLCTIYESVLASARPVPHEPW